MPAPKIQAEVQCDICHKFVTKRQTVAIRKLSDGYVRACRIHPEAIAQAEQLQKEENEHKRKTVAFTAAKGGLTYGVHTDLGPLEPGAEAQRKQLVAAAMLGLALGIAPPELSDLLTHEDPIRDEDIRSRLIRKGQLKQPDPVVVPDETGGKLSAGGLACKKAIMQNFDKARADAIKAEEEDDLLRHIDDDDAAKSDQTFHTKEQRRRDAANAHHALTGE